MSKNSVSSPASSNDLSFSQILVALLKGAAVVAGLKILLTIIIPIS